MYGERENKKRGFQVFSYTHTHTHTQYFSSSFFSTTSALLTAQQKKRNISSSSSSSSLFLFYKHLVRVLCVLSLPLLPSVCVCVHCVSFVANYRLGLVGGANDSIIRHTYCEYDTMLLFNTNTHTHTHTF